MFGKDVKSQREGNYHLEMLQNLEFIHEKKKHTEQVSMHDVYLRSNEKV